MTPKNSLLRPELFLCDACVPEEFLSHKPASADAATELALLRRVEESAKAYSLGLDRPVFLKKRGWWESKQGLLWSHNKADRPYVGVAATKIELDADLAAVEAWRKGKGE